MNIIEAKVRWNEGLGNTPDLIILVEDWPSRDQFVYQVQNGNYYADKDGVVHFVHWKQPGEGFGGRTFELIMQDGTTAKLKGPWSSRPSAMNSARMYRLFNSEPCGQVSVFDDQDSWERGYTAFVGYLTYTNLVRACELAGCHLVCRADKVSGLFDDASAEQLDAATGSQGYEMMSGMWPSIPDGVEFSFYASLQPDRIVKPAEAPN